MFKLISRNKVQKEDNHVAWVDLYFDTETNVEYVAIGDKLCPRYNADGSLVIYKEIV